MKEKVKFKDLSWPIRIILILTSLVLIWFIIGFVQLIYYLYYYY